MRLTRPLADTDCAYLLRCWREGAVWRCSLEPVHPRAQRRGFATLEALAAFLREELARATDNPNSCSCAGAHNRQ